MAKVVYVVPHEHLRACSQHCLLPHLALIRTKPGCTDNKTFLPCLQWWHTAEPRQMIVLPELQCELQMASYM